MSETTQLLLRGGTLVETAAPSLREADLWVERGRIAAVGAPPPGSEEAEAARVLDCEGCLVLPGLVCGHGHLYSALATGMPGPAVAPVNFVEILERVWWRLDVALDEASLRASALAGAVSAIRSGTTCIVDHHASPSFIDGSLDVIAEALEEVGLRSVLCYETTDRGGLERRDAGVRENERFIASQRPLARGLVGGHASFTMGEETLAMCVDLAKRTGTGLHVHAAEDEADERDCLARHGCRVGERLARAGALLPRSLVVHGVRLDEAERRTIASSGCWVAHNPRSNMNNSVGYADPSTLGPKVVLGTDGIGADMLGEAQHAFFRAREASLGTDAATVLGWLARGAELVSDLFGEPVGRLEPGAAADLVVLDAALATPLAAGSLPWHWMFGLSSRGVRDVVVGGRPVMVDRRLETVDERALAAGTRAEARRLWDRMA